MPTVNVEYVGCTALVYCNAGENLGRTIVKNYDKAENLITLQAFPKELNIGDICRLLVLTEPVPRECYGKVKSDVGEKVVALFKWQEKEKRGASRFKVNFSAFIEEMIYNNKSYELLKPYEINLINISTGGMRFYAVPNTVSHDDRFQIRIYLNTDVKVLTAHIVNNRQTAPDRIEYGCRFIDKKRE